MRSSALPVVAVMAAGVLAAAGQTAPAVPGYELLRQRAGEWQADAGEVLLSELSCLACHAAARPANPALAWKSGPDLQTAGSRLRADYVRQFLLDPAKTKPGTTMPNLLAGRTAAERSDLAEVLTHYLMQLRGPLEKPPALAASAERGRDLFYGIGCVACHASFPLNGLREKYAPGALVRFLEHPLSARPAGRMPDFHLSAQEAVDLAAHLVPAESRREPVFAFDTAKVERGREAFATLGCATCHGGTFPAKPLRRLSLESSAGCLAHEPRAGVPHYPLSDQQRATVRIAIKAASEREDSKASVRTLMLQRNCFACHARTGLGGPGPEVAAHFRSSRDDLGDLGRLPPPLDDAGRKFQRPALERILRGQDRVRQYMRVRMPDFGAELAPAMSELLAVADADPHEKPLQSVGAAQLVGRNEWGRDLVGLGGYACVACHDLHGRPAPGIGAYDLAELPKRLRPEWMRDFLLNPAAFPTGTRMPAFWPGGKPANSRVAPGDAERQIDSIRVYLTEVDQSLPPEGLLDPGMFELKPGERPTVFRTFIEGAGTHAIAVGFSQQVHAVFDALEVRWALAWRGRFLDAHSTWNERVAKFEVPLGDETVRLDDAGSLVIAGQEKLARKYRGYRIGSDGVPVFLYDLGALHVEDRIAPDADSRKLRRRLRVTGQTAEAVILEGRAGGELQITVDGRATAAKRLEFVDASAELEQEIAW